MVQLIRNSKIEMNDFERNEQKRLAAEREFGGQPESGMVVPDLKRDQIHIPDSEPASEVVDSVTGKVLERDVTAQHIPVTAEFVGGEGDKLKKIIEAAGSTPNSVENFEAADVLDALNDVIAKNE